MFLFGLTSSQVYIFGGTIVLCCTSVLHSWKSSTNWSMDFGSDKDAFEYTRALIRYNDEYFVLRTLRIT